MNLLLLAGKGATAYELQIGTGNASVVFRWVHLSNGGKFVWWAPWRRFSVKRYGKTGE